MNNDITQQQWLAAHEIIEKMGDNRERMKNVREDVASANESLDEMSRIRASFGKIIEKDKANALRIKQYHASFCAVRGIKEPAVARVSEEENLEGIKLRLVRNAADAKRGADIASSSYKERYMQHYKDISDEIVNPDEPGPSKGKKKHGQ